MIIINYSDSLQSDFDLQQDLFSLVNFGAEDITITTRRISIRDAATGLTFAMTGTFRNLESNNPTFILDGLELLQNGSELLSMSGLGLDLSDAATNPNAVADAFETLLDQPIIFNGSSNADEFISQGFGDVLNGFAGDDDLDGGDGEDQLNGGDGDDLMSGGSGADRFNGGAGVDTVDYQDDPGADGVRVNMITGNILDRSGARDVFESIENVIGTAVNDIIFGDQFANRLEGLAGDDALNGRGGDDVVIGGEGNDILVGGAGNDSLFGGDGDDLIGGRIGDDVIEAGAGADTVVGQLGDDIIEGGFGDDALNGGGGFDIIDGGAGDDVILGRSGADFIDGSVGNDELNGGTGDDRIEGAGGDDILIGGADADVLIYRTTDFGNDTVFRYLDGVDSFEVSTLLADSFADLTIEQVGADAVISFAGGTITLVNRDASILDAGDFTFV